MSMLRVYQAGLVLVKLDVHLIFSDMKRWTLYEHVCIYILGYHTVLVTLKAKSLLVQSYRSRVRLSCKMFSHLRTPHPQGHNTYSSEGTQRKINQPREDNFVPAPYI